MADLMDADADAGTAGEVPLDTDELVVTAPVYQARHLGPIFWVAVVFVVALVLAAIFAPWLPIKDPDKSFSGHLREGPSLEFWFGTDNVSFDVFSRVIYGARISLLVAGAATLIGMVVGGAIGIVTGYFRGVLDSVLTGAVDLVLVFPALILALSMILFFDPDAKNRPFWLIVVLGLLSIPPIARIVRSVVVSYSDREFVQASHLMGARDGRIMRRELLPNVMPALLSYALVFMAILIVVEAGIGFLGLSVPPPQPTWGDMINKGRDRLAESAHISLAPAFTLFLTVLALNYIGDKLREMYDVRESFL